MIQKYRPMGYWPKVRSKREHWDWIDSQHVKAVDMYSGGTYALERDLIFGNKGLNVTAGSGVYADRLTVGLNFGDTEINTKVFLLENTSTENVFYKDVKNKKIIYEQSGNLTCHRIDELDTFGGSVTPGDWDILYIHDVGSGHILYVNPPVHPDGDSLDGLTLRMRCDDQSNYVSAQFWDNGSFVERFDTTVAASWWAEAVWRDTGSEWRIVAWGGDGIISITP